MFIDFLINIFREVEKDDFIVWNEKTYSYGWLAEKVAFFVGELNKEGIVKSSVVSLEGDFTPNSIAVLLALIENGCVIIPLASSVEVHKKKFLEIAQAEFRVTVNESDDVSFEKTGVKSVHLLYSQLSERGNPGLVLFSSGSTGEPKAAVHDFVGLLEKFKMRKQVKRGERMLAFLLFDHIGGVNTLFYTLTNGGSLITISERTGEGVLSLVEKYKVQVLPVSPSFMNMIIISEAYKNFDISSVKRIPYGTEVMPESTLNMVGKIFPNVVMQQTYGLSEVGILRSQSKSSDSLWVKIGGEGFETRIIDGMLQIKAQSAMLGYLNAPSPFTEDGWFMTGDEVETDGDYYLIKGRRSEIINVGGQKVYPAEVEDVIMQMDGVEDAAVMGEKNPIIGQMVVAHVRLKSDEDLKTFTSKLRAFCKTKLQSFQIPQKIVLEDKDFVNARFKKVRKG